MYTCARCVYGRYMYTCTRFGSTYCQLFGQPFARSTWRSTYCQLFGQPLRASSGVPLPAGSASGSGAPHPDVARLVEDVVAWQITNETQRTPKQKARDNEERNLGMRLAKLLVRREKV